MKSIFLFELQYRLKRPATYIYALLFFLFGILAMATDGVRIGGGYGKVFSNAPYNIHQIMSIIGILGIFIIMAFHAVPIYRDVEHKVDSFLYTYPINRISYLNGRFWGTFFLCTIVYFFLPLGMMVGEIIGRQKGQPDDWGPFSAITYLWPFLICCIPTIFLLGSMFFSMVTLTRKMMAAYLVAISFIVLYSVGLDLLSKLDNKLFASLLDPFGMVASGRITEYWSISQKNSSIVPLEGVFLANRLIWLSLAIGFLLTSFIRFKMSPVVDKGKTGQKEENATAPVLQSPSIEVAQPSSFQVFMSMLKTEINQNFRNVFFLTFLFAIAIFLGFGTWYADEIYETGIYPVTGTMIESATEGNFFVLSIALLIFMAGEVVWRERQNNMDGIFNAFPTSNASIFWSKLISLWFVPFILMILVGVVCMAVQLLKGYTYLEPELYVKTLFLFELPRYLLIASLAFCIQILANNKFLGHSLILLYYLSFIGLQYLHIEHPLFRFGSGLSYMYSDMNGFGEMAKGFRAFLLHWSVVSVVLLSIAYLGLVRGSESALSQRWKLAKQRVQHSKPITTILGLGILAMLSSGYYIFHQTVVVDKYENSKVREGKQVEYEKKFGYLMRRPQPSLKSVKVGADLFPETNEATLTGNFVYENLNKQAVDTLWFNLNPDQTNRRFNINRPNKLVFEDKEKGIYAYQLTSPLAPGDTFLLDMEFYLGFTGLKNESPVRGNGTFFNNNSWPSLGFNENYQLSDDDKRKENGLPEMPTLPSTLDSASICKSLFDQQNHHILFEATVSTSPDQIAIAPGYLTKEWMENGRRYFHYKMDRPISHFYAILSARYSTYKEKWNDVDITIYHHSWHNFNVKKMAESVRHSLDYYSKNFGPYQHKQVRIIEFPRYSSFAQSFDNTIPFSEGIGFIANLKEEEAIDFVYFVTAHEMAHQWWAHQISPAYARGGQFLSETMSEFAALMVMRNRYGEALMGRFLRKELNDYLSGRSSERRKENPLMEIEMQSYAYYNKGSLAMYKVMEILTEGKFNTFIKDFVSRYAFKIRPYPTTYDFSTHLKTYADNDQWRRIEDQIHKITLYKNKVVEAKGKKKKDGTYEVTMSVELAKVYADSLGKETAAPFDDPIAVGLLNKENPFDMKDVILLETRKLKSGESIILTSKQKPKYASIDPLHTYTDINMEDNAKIISWENE